MASLLMQLIVLVIASIVVLILILIQTKKLMEKIRKRGTFVVDINFFNMLSLFVKVKQTGSCKKIHNKKNKYR